MKTQTLLSYCFTVLLITASIASAATPPRPNIIVFLTDDQDKMSLTPYGGKSLTPEIDQMAAEGMVFHNAHVTSTVCTPSRYSFLTGRYASRCYHPRYLAECPAGMQAYPEFNVAMEADKMNIGAVMQKAGYRTGYVGKFHVGSHSDEDQDGHISIPKNAKDTPETNELFRKKELQNRAYIEKLGFDWAKNIYGGNMNNPYNDHNLEWTIDAALEFIEDSKDMPFYLHFCTTLTHGPDRSWNRSIENPYFTGAGKIKTEIKPEGMATRPQILAELKKSKLDPEQGHAGYRWVDAGVGAILKKLKQLGIDDNTLVIFTSDHGSNQKGSLFNKDGTCVPFIARWPKGIKPGVQNHELVQSTDIAATAFELANAAVPNNYILDGRSLTPLFKGKTPDNWRQYIYTEIGSGRAVQTRQWKYITTRFTTERVEAIKKGQSHKLVTLCAPFKRSGIGIRGAKNPNFYSEDQLYKIAEDKLEQTNLASSPKHQNELKYMKKYLTAELKKMNRPYGEFIPGGNAAAPGQVDEQITLAKQMKVQGKTVILPDGTTASSKREKKTRPKTRKSKTGKRRNRK